MYYSVSIRNKQVLLINASYIRHKEQTKMFFEVLPTFLFIKSEMMAIITYKHGIYYLRQELPQNLRLRTLGN